MEIKGHIKNGKFDPWYIFCGEEHEIAKIYIHMMADKFNADVQYVDSITDLHIRTKVSSLFSEHHLYVLIDDKEFLTNEKLWGFSGIKDAIVIFYYTSVDRRLKFWKNFQDRAANFERLEDRILVKYINKEISLSEENCRLLIDACEGDYGRILSELDKIKQYGEWSQVINEDKIFELLLKAGVIYRQPKDAIFDFVNAFLERDAIKAYNLLEQSYEVGEANMTLLSVLYNNVKTLLQIQSGDVKGLGLNGWTIKNISPYKGNYSNGELVRCMRLIRQCEKGIKTGTMPDDISVNYVMVNVM